MIDDDKDHENREWFEQNIGGQLRRLDEALQPQEPEPHAMEAFVAEGKRELRRKLGRELVAFWIVAAIVIGGMIWTIERSWMLFIALQTIAALSAIGLLSVRLLRHAGKGSRQWKRD